VLALLRRALCSLVAAALVASAGATVGAGADSPFAWYLSRVKAKIAERWAGKALPGQQPVAVFEITREGQISRLAIEKSSGNTDYDQAALRAITEANPFPPLPAGLAATLPITLDFDFASFDRQRLEAEEEHRRKEKQAEQERNRLEQERLRQAEERRRREIAAKPWPDEIKQAALEKRSESV
jgi:TonB family protein